MGTPVAFICKNVATLSPKEASTKKLATKPIVFFDSELRPIPLIIKPAKGSTGISQMYLSISYYLF